MCNTLAHVEKSSLVLVNSDVWSCCMALALVCNFYLLRTFANWSNSAWLHFFVTAPGCFSLASRLMVASRKAKEEVPCDGLLMSTREYFTRINLFKIKNAITDRPT